jgi:pyruvate dehydrogenase E2 component (dihydrolipoamide acetyltransferase)
MMKNIHSRKIKINGRDVHYFVAGHGDPLVVIHGGGGDAGTWLNNAAVLSDRYTVYVPDLPGFGDSQPLDGDYDIPELAEFVDDFVSSLGLENFHLVGHSVGGGVALNYALKSPRKIKKLVLISSLCLGREIALWVRLMSVPARAIGSTILAVLGGVKWLVKTLMIPVKFAVPLSRASVNLGSGITTLREQTLVLAHRLSELVMPTLVVWGAKDRIVPVRQAYVAAQVIPNCQLKVFEDCGHSVYREKISEFPRLLTGFLG